MPSAIAISQGTLATKALGDGLIGDALMDGSRLIKFQILPRNRYLAQYKVVGVDMDFAYVLYYKYDFKQTLPHWASYTDMPCNGRLMADGRIAASGLPTASINSLTEVVTLT